MDIFDVLTIDKEIIKTDIDVTAFAPSWQNIATLDTDRVAGVYEVQISMVWNYDITNKSGKFRWTVDGHEATPTWLETSEEPKDKTDLRPFTISFPVEHTGGVRKIMIEAAREDDTHTMTMKYVAVTYKRIG